MDGFSKYHFKDLGEDEQIIKVVHRNWFYIFQQFFVLIILSIAFYAAVFTLPMFFPELLGRDYVPVLNFGENFLMLVIWIYGFLIWIDYFFDIWIITDQRIVNIEQKGLFMRRVSEVMYDKIQDVTTQVNGFLPTVVNFGDVMVQTAAEQEEFLFRTVSDPYAIKNLIISMQKKAETSSTEKLGEMIKEKIGG